MLRIFQILCFLVAFCGIVLCDVYKISPAGVIGVICLCLGCLIWAIEDDRGKKPSSKR